MTDILEEEFIGFKLEDGKFIFQPPKFISQEGLKQEDKLDLAFKYLRLFRKYRYDSIRDVKDDDIEELSPSESKDRSFSIFEGYYLLLMDFTDFGPFTFREELDRKQSSGRINWGKTISKTDPLVADNTIIYRDPYYRETRTYYSHPLSLLYGSYLLDLEDYLGLRLDLPSYYRNLIQAEKNLNPDDILINYRTRVFTDRGRKVLAIMEAINYGLRSASTSFSTARIEYLENMNNLWELMLKRVLRDQYYDFKSFFPKGGYDLKLEGARLKSAGSRMKPDIIKESGGKLYIIDAKNYLPHISGNLPKTGDINKQILYRYFLSSEFNPGNRYRLKDIVNIFIMPNLLDRPSKYIGSHGFNNMKSDLADIHIYQVDMDYIIDLYMKDSSVDIKELIKKGP